MRQYNLVSWPDIKTFALAFAEGNKVSVSVEDRHEVFGRSRTEVDLRVEGLCNDEFNGDNGGMAYCYRITGLIYYSVNDINLQGPRCELFIPTAVSYKYLATLTTLEPQNQREEHDEKVRLKAFENAK